MLVLYDGKIGLVVSDAGVYVRFVEPNGSVRMVKREHVLTKFKNGSSYYEYDGSDVILYDYNHTPEDDRMAVEFASADIHF